MQFNSAPRTPPSLWLVALISLAWHCFGAYDFVLTNIRDAGYLGHFPPELVEYLDDMPVWAVIAWALTILCAVAGSLLLMLRSRFALEAFLLSLVCLGLGAIYQGVSQVPAAMRTPGWMVFTLLSWMVAIGLAAFAFWHRRTGVLR